MVRVSFMYPNRENVQFDHDYYQNQHSALLRQQWDPLGLKNFEIDEGIGGGPAGETAPYVAVAHATFESLEAFQRAFDEAGAVLLADIPNYSNVEPIMQIGEIADLLTTP